MAKYKGVNVLEVLEGADRYNRWISERIKPFVKSPALEVGAGTGNISAFFSSLKSFTLTDNDNELVEGLQKRFSKNKNVRVEVLDIEKKFTKIINTFNTIFSINVLEHVKNDELALRNMNKLLDKKGRIILLVPAKRFAYTGLDKELGHHRRYEKKELETKLINAGFEVEYLAYFNLIGLLSWMVRDKISNGNSLKPSHVRLFDNIVPLLKIIEPRRRLPLGISLIAVGKKI